MLDHTSSHSTCTPHDNSDEAIRALHSATVKHNRRDTAVLANWAKLLGARGVTTSSRSSPVGLYCVCSFGHVIQLNSYVQPLLHSVTTVS